MIVVVGGGTTCALGWGNFDMKADPLGKDEHSANKVKTSILIFRSKQLVLELGTLFILVL